MEQTRILSFKENRFGWVATAKESLKPSGCFYFFFYEMIQLFGNKCSLAKAMQLHFSLLQKCNAPKLLCVISFCNVSKCDSHAGKTEKTNAYFETM